MKKSKTTEIFKLLMLFMTIVSFAGCNKFEDYDKPIFTIQCDISATDPDYMYIYFTTTAKTFPEVTINGVQIKNWWLDDGDIQGDLYLKYNNDVEYSVTESNKTTSGTISFPEIVGKVKCNNKGIDVGYTGNITPNNSYDFEWDNVDFDYQIFSCANTTPEVHEVLEPDVCEYSIDGADLDEYYQDNYFYVYVKTYNGARISTGGKPNVDGKYGKGFVLAYAYGGSFKIDLASSSSYETAMKDTPIQSNLRETCSSRNKAFKEMLQTGNY
jgi:hypothetical protein